MSVPCKLCGKTDRAEGCDQSELWMPGAFAIKRIPYDAAEEHPCHDCGTAPGKYHHLDCDMERCPACNGQLLTCGHSDVTYDQWLEEHQARVQAQQDAEHFEKLATIANACFTESFTANAVDDLRRVLNTLLPLHVPKELVEDINVKFQAVLDRLSLLQQVVTIEPIATTPGGPDGYFRATIKVSEAADLVGEGNSPHQAVELLRIALEGVDRERQEALESEHRFRSALRHVQTELVVMQHAISVAHRDATRALDRADGTAAGHYEEAMPAQHQETPDDHRGRQG